MAKICEGCPEAAFAKDYHARENVFPSSYIVIPKSDECVDSLESGGSTRHRAQLDKIIGKGALNG